MEGREWSGGRERSEGGEEWREWSEGVREGREWRKGERREKGEKGEERRGGVERRSGGLALSRSLQPPALSGCSPAAPPPLSAPPSLGCRPPPVSV
jgi:hypothetical protein